jgi:hypothetical protein
MHTEILDKRQAELLPYLKRFQKSFHLVGGTAIALHIGHRRSIDFDLFANSPLVKYRLKKMLEQIPFSQVLLFEDYDQLHVQINSVKLTFFSFPFSVPHPVKIDSIISMPELISLAAMKAFALGRRSKWKDYVDLYFIIKDHYPIPEISREANNIFSAQFSEKLFREQLAFHKDIDYSETVNYIKEEVPENEIREYLIEKAVEI